MTARIDWGKYIIIFVQYFFGAHSLLSGSNHFLHFLPEPMPNNPLATPFMIAMSNMGLFNLIKVVETLVGVCLLLNVWVPLAAVAEMPVTVVIWYLSVVTVHEPRPIYTGWRELGLNVFLIAAYAGYFLPLLNPRLPRQELWKAWRPRRKVVESEMSA
jgi:uncharacterized membrane protein YphA (DoxX/SURF4 family)